MGTVVGVTLKLGWLVGSRVGLTEIVGDTVPDGVLEGTVITTVLVSETLPLLVGSLVGITGLVGDAVSGEL